MIIKSVISALLALLILAPNTGFSADRKKFEKLPMAKPCFFLVDEDMQPTGDPINAPCDLNTRKIQPGDTVDPEQRKKYGKIKKDSKESSLRESNT